MQGKLGFLKTTAIGGVLFLFPLMVVGALLGQMAPIVMTVAEFLGEWIPVRTPVGISLLILCSLSVVLGLFFGAGLLARRSWGKRISVAFERNLCFPGMRSSKSRCVVVSAAMN